MHYSILLDVAGPGLLLVAAGGILGLCLATVIIITIEGIILWRLRWGSFKRALLAATLMNIASTILGFGLVSLTIQWGFLGLSINLALSILLEGMVLMLLKNKAIRENWIAALVANCTSYLLVILPLYLFFDLLK